ncbi:MAG: IS630 family transposase, partial [Pseudomonadota bacterium]
MTELRDALAEAGGVEVHYSTISYALRRFGFTYKKTLAADERRRPDIVSARRDWIGHRQPRMRKETHRLVFIDEAAVKTNMTRLRGRILKGQRLHSSAPLGKWRTQTFIAGLTSDSLIAPWIIPGAMNGD